MLGLGVSIPKASASSEWLPSEISSIIHWYRFETGISTTTIGETTDQVIRWDDQVGSNHVTSDEEDSTLCPTQVENSIFFDANTEVLNFGSALSLGTFAIYFRLKWKSDNTINAEEIIEGSNDKFIVFSPTEMRVKIGTGSDSRHDYSIREITEGNVVTLGFERDSNGDMMVYKNGETGTLIGSDDGNISTGITLDVTRFGKPTQDSYWYEVIVCNNSLSSGDRALLENHLSQFPQD